MSKSFDPNDTSDKAIASLALDHAMKCHSHAITLGEDNERLHAKIYEQKLELAVLKSEVSELRGIVDEMAKLILALTPTE